MTEPITPPPSTSVDPITAILLSVTRIEGNLAGALDTLKRHDGELVQLRTDVSGLKDDHGNRLTALEERGKSDETHHTRTVSARAAFWAAASAVVMFAALLVSLWMQHR